MLTLESVIKNFQKVTAVSNLSFRINKGEIFALLGPNGAGKTTTVRMIMQIIKPDQGKISFDPSIMKNGNVERAKLGYLPEERGLYQDATLIKSLIYLATLRGIDPENIEKHAEYWLERFGLIVRRNEKVSTLSKGNQQKVQFITAILHKPEFVVLDEPFSGFDPINQELILDIIKELRNQGMTILLSAHQMQLVEKIADRIILINDGQEIISGTLDEIRKKTFAGQKLIVTYTGNVESEVLDNSPHIRSISDVSDGSREIYMDEQSAINQVLPDLLRAGSIEQIHSAKVSLHDIFIESFKRANDV